MRPPAVATLGVCLFRRGTLLYVDRDPAGTSRTAPVPSRRAPATQSQERSTARWPTPPSTPGHCELLTQATTCRHCRDGRLLPGGRGTTRDSSPARTCSPAASTTGSSAGSSSSKAWTRVRKGAYCFTFTWQTLDDVERHRRLARAVLHSHGDAVVLSKVSGLLMRPGCDVWNIDLSRVHVTRRDGRSGSIERDVVHHEGALAEDDIEVVDGLLVMRESRCVVETIATAGVEPGLVVADAALHSGRVDAVELSRDPRVTSPLGRQPNHRPRAAPHGQSRRVRR